MTSFSTSRKKPQSAVQRKIAELESALIAERQKAIEAESAKQAQYKAGFIDGLFIARIQAEKAAEIIASNTWIRKTASARSNVLASRLRLIFSRYGCRARASASKPQTECRIFRRWCA